MYQIPALVLQIRARVRLTQRQSGSGTSVPQTNVTDGCLTGNASIAYAKWSLTMDADGDRLRPKIGLRSLLVGTLLFVPGALFLVCEWHLLSL